MPSFMLSLTLVVRLYDTAGVSPQHIAAAQQAAASVLAGASIDVAWIACTRPAPHDACGQKPKASDLLLRIVAQSPNAASQALADAYVDRHAANGALATVYWQRVRVLATAAGVDVGTVMGRAIAHEVGHLLLGTTEHSSGGVMRAVWSAPLLRRDQPRMWRFSASEAVRMRTRLAARLDADAVERVAGLVEPVPPTRPGCPKAVPERGPREATLTCAQSR
jgi:hypothetical protein